MKKWGILLLAGLAGAFILAGCQQAVDLSGYAKLSDLANSKIDCQTCHVSEYVATGDYALVDGKYPSATNQSEYLFSGHEGGLRATVAAEGTHSTFDSAPFSESALAGSTCSRCHTGSGFAYYITNGTSANVSVTSVSTGVVYTPTASAPGYGWIGCTACHDPMSSGDYSLRTTASVAMTSGPTYSAGAGNLCVTVTRIATMLRKLIPI